MSSILVVSAIHYQDADGSSFPEAECVKIDIEFVRDLASNTANQHLVKATGNIAQGFGVQTIAERVEDARRWNCCAFTASIWRRASTSGDRRRSAATSGSRHLSRPRGPRRQARPASDRIKSRLGPTFRVRSR